MENKIKRTSSDSTQPKIKLALEEKYKKENTKRSGWLRTFKIKRVR